MGCGASAEAAPKKGYAFRFRLLGGLNLYNNGFGIQVPGTYTNAGRFEGSSDPYAIIECSGSTQRFESEVRLNTQNPVWNQEFYFNTTTKAPVVTITIKDKDVLSGDDILGKAVVPLNGLITRAKERECWVPLKQSRAGGEVGFAVIEAFRTHITAKSGVDVQPMDSLSGSSDCYMTLQVGQQQVQKTAVKGWTLNPVWNETFTFFVPYGIKSQVAMILYDKDSVGVDTNMGWYYHKFDGKVLDKPLELNVPICNAKGKLLFTVVDDTVLEGVTEAPALTEADKKNFPGEIPSSVTFDVRVLGAYNLAVADSNFVYDAAKGVEAWAFNEFKEYQGKSDPFARVTVEGVTYDTHHINNSLEPVWNERFRFVARDRQNTKIKIEVMDDDLLVNDSIGAVTIPVEAMKPGRPQEIWSYLDRGRGEIGVEVIQHHLLNVKIVSGTNLPAKDLNGMCDPYVKLELGGTEFQTNVVRNDCNPWFEEDFRFALANVRGLKLNLRVFDSDLMIFKKGMSEDFIGQAAIDLNDLIPGLPTEFNVALTNGGAKNATLKVIITEEVPLPESALNALKQKGREAFEAAVKGLNQAKEMVTCLKLPDFDKKEEAEFEVADPKLAPRPRFSRIAVEVVALRGLKGIHEPYYVGVSLPLQGRRDKTKQYKGAKGADFNGEIFSYGVPSRLTGALEFHLFETAKAEYTSWSNKYSGRARLQLKDLNDGEGSIRGSAADDTWVDLTDSTGAVVGQVIVRVKEEFRFQVKVKGGTEISTKKDPFVRVVYNKVVHNTNYVSADPKKDRTTGEPGKPVWNEQFTFFSAEKGEIKFQLFDTGVVNDAFIAEGKFDLNQPLIVRRGVPVQTTIALSNGGKLEVEILEEEKMSLLDRMIDGAANAAKLASALASELADGAKSIASDAASAASGALASLSGKLPF